MVGGELRRLSDIGAATALQLRLLARQSEAEEGRGQSGRVHREWDSVSLILQAWLGGNAKDFDVIHLSGWMFKFSVFCKNVGFMIYMLKSHSCKSFAIFFHLWSGGGPNWRKDHSLWLQEQDAEWHLVGSKSKKSYADVAKSSIKNQFSCAYLTPPTMLPGSSSPLVEFSRVPPGFQSFALLLNLSKDPSTLVPMASKVGSERRMFRCRSQSRLCLRLQFQIQTLILPLIQRLQIRPA